ncbi:MAG: Rrf2 family transcriptional regulator [Proteobacteria bacterium]|nr:Rrf2 family transcriptional regulator [Pseudomonadota bacterium]
MKLKTRERYSLRMMMAIAKLSSDENPVGLGVVSRHCGISRRYLEQLITPLKNAALVRSLSGRGGGYSLAREATDIKVNDVKTVAWSSLS